MTNAIIVFTAAMLAAIGSLLLAIFNIVDFPVAILSGAAVFLGMTQIHAAFLRKREKRVTRTEIAMNFLTWVIVGLIAGVLASLLLGGVGYGIIGDIIVGIVGAFIGGWLFAEMGWTAPLAGLAGTIFVAFIGAVVLLFLIRLVRGSYRRPL